MLDRVLRLRGGADGSTFTAADLIASVKARDPDQPEFLQTVTEVCQSLEPFIKENPKYAAVMSRIVEPERQIMFRVPWVDDQGNTQVNRGYRVQFNSAIGPYKGGLRFHPSVTLSIIKFLGFEQVFKNSLTTLQMGGGKGGSDFDPKGKSDREVMAFCQSFMTELQRHIGSNTDVPAGDIGVGGREIGFMYGQYKRLRNEVTGVLTGKGLEYGGSLIRPEATGYGLVYLVMEMLKVRGEDLKGKVVAISGSGNVAQYAAEKAEQLGAKVVTVSDSNGFIYDEGGVDYKRVMELKNVQRARISEYGKGTYIADRTPWKWLQEKNIHVDVVLPCATQNELDEKDAEALVKLNPKIVVAEGANMPCTLGAVHYFEQHKVPLGPAKAANAGGVAVSGLEMAQNSQRLAWTTEEVDAKLHSIMQSIHASCVKYGKSPDGSINYVNGANIAGFVKVADAMLDHGVV